jgi:hypothetical protein
MSRLYKLSLAVFALLLAIPAALSAKPSPPADHPAYLHALTDLRAARAHLQRPDGSELRDQEKKAIHEIDEAVNEIKKASIVDTRMPWDGRLHRALQLLDKAHQDISQEEDNRFAQGLQERAFIHIDKAHHHVEEAINLVR